MLTADSCKNELSKLASDRLLCAMVDRKMWPLVQTNYGPTVMTTRELR